MTPDLERREFLDLLALPTGAALLEVDGTPRLDLPASTYDGILCVDGIARVRDRAAIFAAWARALKPGGRLLYTDPALIAGLVTSEEIAGRSGGGLLVLAPQGENESLLEAAGFRLLRADDATDAMAASDPLAAERRLARIAFLAEKLT